MAGAVEAATSLLVVDDQRETRTVLELFAATGGYDCATAADAAEARTLLGQRPFALMLADLSMPGESGLGLAQHVASAFPETATIIMSGSDDPAIAHRAVELGAYAYLTKPFSLNQFLIAVGNAFRRRELELERRAYGRRLERAVRARTAELHRSHAEVVRRLALAVEARDSETGAHVERMSALSAAISRTLGFGRRRSTRIGVASSLHDIGKIAVPDRILHKPGPLTLDERRVMERHTEVGRELLSGSGEVTLELASTIAWTHHERLDGSGYPRGLRREEIPIEGRIAAVADVFDALTDDRPYRGAVTEASAIAVLEAGAGELFDRQVVAALRRALGAARRSRKRRNARVR